jgi:hypothetical protein
MRVGPADIDLLTSAGQIVLQSFGNATIRFRLIFGSFLIRFTTRMESGDISPCFDIRRNLRDF